jgi:IclR family acetate operon transcriptional repressor
LSQAIENTVSNGGHRTANRLLDILELLAAQPAPCALRHLSLALAAPKSSLIPLLRTLVERGYISQDENSNYRLGTKVLELIGGLDAEHDLRDIAHAELLALRNLTDESTILVRLTSDRNAVVYIDKVEGSHRIRAAAKVGETRCLHSTSSGKLLLAYMPDDERRAIIDEIAFTRFTKKTTRNKTQLKAELKTILDQGYCVNIDQSVMGHCAIAAPVRNHWGEVIAACVLSAPTERVQNTLTELTAELTRAAEAISRKLGYTSCPANITNQPVQRA